MKVFQNKKKIRGYKEFLVYFTIYYSGGSFCILSALWLVLRIF